MFFGLSKFEYKCKHQSTLSWWTSKQWAFRQNLVIFVKLSYTCVLILGRVANTLFPHLHTCSRTKKFRSNLSRKDVLSFRSQLSKSRSFFSNPTIRKTCFLCDPKHPKDLLSLRSSILHYHKDPRKSSILHDQKYSENRVFFRIKNSKNRAFFTIKKIPQIENSSRSDTSRKSSILHDHKYPKNRAFFTIKKIQKLSILHDQKYPKIEFSSWKISKN